jgi:hypothetical protein
MVEYRTIPSAVVDGIGMFKPQRVFSVCAKKSVVTPPENGVAEKFPTLSSAVGTVTVSDEVPLRRRSPS